MRKFLFLLLIAACHAPQREATSRWADERLWPVLEAQEHRDTKKLCDLLKDANPVVREAAALAFSSVQDSLGVPCLLGALRDDVAEVRAASAFALTWVADTVVVRALNAALEAEADSAARIVVLHAAFRAELNAQEHDALWLIGFLENDDAVIRLLAAQKLARSKSALADLEHGVLHATHVEADPEVRAFLVQSLRRGSLPASLDSLRKWTASDKSASVRIAAIRALAKRVDTPSFELLEALKSSTPGIRMTALDAIKAQSFVDAELCVRMAGSSTDTLVRIGMLGLARKHGPLESSITSRKALNRIGPVTDDPYRMSSLLEALSFAADAEEFDDLRAILQSNEHPALRHAAFQGMVRVIRENMMRSRFASREAQYAQLSEVVASAITTGDAGLICAVAELLQEEEADAIRILLPVGLEQRALATLQPIQDLEALLLLRQATAKRDGLPLQRMSAHPSITPSTRRSSARWSRASATASSPARAISSSPPM
ncbi:MAG TPA: HEAT repeat domain-containing protein [Flavobacteriales bacterium]|nr:HEAT repeat domain-containing protein [Flavobacteriales bacterium]HRD51053.1 HEAT repeat domain-containing protein [Flavobacteriales bacterium]